MSYGYPRLLRRAPGRGAAGQGTLIPQVLGPPLLEQHAAKITTHQFLRLARIQLRVLQRAPVSAWPAPRPREDIQTFGRAVPALGSSASASMCACETPRTRANTRQISYFVNGSAAEKCRIGGSGVPRGSAACGPSASAVVPAGAQERTREAREEAPDVERVRGEARRVVVHAVALAGLVAHDVEQDVDRGVLVLRRGAVPADRTRSGPELWAEAVHAQDGDTQDDGPRALDAEDRELAVALRHAVVVHGARLRGGRVRRRGAVEHVVCGRRQRRSGRDQDRGATDRWRCIRA
jgi:hypothetical protein